MAIGNLQLLSEDLVSRITTEMICPDLEPGSVKPMTVSIEASDLDEPPS